MSLLIKGLPRQRLWEVFLNDGFVFVLTHAGLYILEFSPNQRVWRWGRKSKGEKREKKEIWGKYNFLQCQIIKLN